MKSKINKNLKTSDTKNVRSELSKSMTTRTKILSLSVLSLCALVLTLVTSSPAFASFHEIELHSTEALLTFSEENSMNIEGNYLMFLDNDWQILFGANYEQLGDLLTRAGVTVGGVYNFGAPDHNEKYYVKPQLTYNNFDVAGNSESVFYISGVIGKRFPIFKNDQYTVNYTPSIGVSIPLSNTNNFDTIISVSLVGLSLVFK